MRKGNTIPPHRLLNPFDYDNRECVKCWTKSAKNEPRNAFKWIKHQPACLLFTNTQNFEWRENVCHQQVQTFLCLRLLMWKDKIPILLKFTPTSLHIDGRNVVVWQPPHLHPVKVWLLFSCAGVELITRETSTRNYPSSWISLRLFLI